MMKNSNSAVLIDQLLDLLAVEHRTPSLEALTQVVTGYVMQVPFENISKLYYRKRFGRRSLPDLQTFVNGIESCNFGGTCYTNNYYLHLLLSHLGYEVKLCGADMSNPDVHVVNVVSVEDRELLVDAGYAAPFLNPLPLDTQQNYSLTLGRDTYVLHPKDKQGRSSLEMYRNGELKHGYTVNPIPRGIDYFKKVIEDSFRDSATFMNSILLARFFPNRSVVIHNSSIITSQGSAYSIIEVHTRDKLIAIVEKQFGIPFDVVSEAISELGELQDSWS
jgi:arylamine N-acetyltransferase